MCLPIESWVKYVCYMEYQDKIFNICLSLFGGREEYCTNSILCSSDIVIFYFLGVSSIFRLFLHIILSLPFYRTRVRSLGMLVTNWVTHCCLVNLIDVKMTTQNLLRLRLKLSFCSYFEHKVSRFGQDFEVGSWSRFWRCLIKIYVRTCDMT